MKKIQFFSFVSGIVCTCIFGLFISCDNDNEAVLNTETVQESINGDDLKTIFALGFDTTDIIETETYYLVEGDIMLNKVDLRNYEKTDSITTKQAHSTNLVSATNIANIKIKIDASLYSTSDWRQAILQAMNHWNNTFSSVNMIEVSSNPDITIKSGSLGSNVCGQGDFPISGGKAGITIDINTAYNSLTLSQKIFLIAHELGHNIGFRHTNWIARGESTNDGAIHIPGTPTGSATDSDPNSVFNAATCGFSWNGFSQYDLIAIQTLYPSDIKINAANSLMCINENSLYTLSGNIYEGATINWEAGANLTLISGQGTKNATFRGTGNGYGTVKAIITSNGSNITIQNTNTWVGPPSFINSSYAWYSADLAQKRVRIIANQTNIGGINLSNCAIWKITSPEYGTLSAQCNQALISFKKMTGVMDVTGTFNNQCGSSDLDFYIEINN